MVISFQKEKENSNLKKVKSKKVSILMQFKPIFPILGRTLFFVVIGLRSLLDDLQEHQEFIHRGNTYKLV